MRKHPFRSILALIFLVALLIVPVTASAQEVIPFTCSVELMSAPVVGAKVTVSVGWQYNKVFYTNGSGVASGTIDVYPFDTVHLKVEKAGFPTLYAQDQAPYNVNGSRGIAHYDLYSADWLYWNVYGPRPPRN